ncbi:MAG TPA: hypothetical protein VFJ58_16740 [Armatimonadota bacterium]|nr:hypothetical protein [Armatimonadota bacterium]
MFDSTHGASGRRLIRAALSRALVSGWLLAVALSQIAFAITVPERVHQTGDTAAEPAPAAIPATTLMRELTAVQNLARLDLTPAQRTVLKQMLPPPDSWPDNPTGPLTTAERVNHLLREERNAIVSSRPLPVGFSAALDTESALDDEWNAVRQRDLERAALTLLPSLSADQRGVLLKPQPTVTNIQVARNYVQRARRLGAPGKEQLAARVQRLWPTNGTAIAAILTSVGAIPPDQFARERSALEMRVAGLIAASTPASRETDASTAAALENLLDSPAADAALGPKPSTMAQPSDLRNLREALQVERVVLEKQIQTIRLLLTLGFTGTEIRAAEPSLAKADKLRDLNDTQSQRTRAALTGAVTTAEAALATGKAPSRQAVSVKPDFLAAFQYQTLNISADDQLAAMAILNASPSSQAASMAGSYLALQRAQQIGMLLQRARVDYSLQEFLARKSILAAQITRYLKAPDTVKAQIETTLDRTRLMTGEEFAIRLPALTRSLIALAAPGPAPAAKANNVPPLTAAQKTAAIEASEEIQNKAAERLGPLLNVPGLSEALL